MLASLRRLTGRAALWLAALLQDHRDNQLAAAMLRRHAARERRRRAAMPQTPGWVRHLIPWWLMPWSQRRELHHRDATERELDHEHHVHDVARRRADKMSRRQRRREERQMEDDRRYVEHVEEEQEREHGGE